MKYKQDTLKYINRNNNKTFINTEKTNMRIFNVF